MALAAAAALAAILTWRGVWSRTPEGPVGLFTTLPILWNEGDDIGAMLRSDAPAHWARGVLEDHGKIVPLDTLSGSLGGIGKLVVAQPRPLSPTENVELDAWVRNGGKLLLLADPLLTEDSQFAVGDRRRPQDVVLLSPILKRWGLELTIDDRQDVIGDEIMDVMGITVPVNISGLLVVHDSENCRSWNQGLAVSCAIGKGRVFVLADAAVLERDDPDGKRAKAFDYLLDAAFAAR